MRKAAALLGALVVVGAVSAGSTGAQSTGPPPNTLAFWDASTGLAGTGDEYSDGGGTIELTTDGGKTFTPVMHTSAGVAWLEVAGTQDAWAAVQGQNSEQTEFHETLFHSADGGHTWQQLPDHPFAPSFATPDDGMAIGASIEQWYGRAIEAKRIVVTHDGGTSWQRIQTPCPARKYMGALPAMQSARVALAVCVQEGFVGMEPKAIFRTTNAGRSWTKLITTDSCRRHSGICTLGFTSMLELDATGDGALVTPDARPYSTSDSGRTWTHDRHGSPGRSTSWMQPLSKTETFALVGWGSERRLVVTHDSGTTWTAVHRWPND